MGERLRGIIHTPHTGKLAVGSALLLAGCWWAGKPPEPMTATEAAKVTAKAKAEADRKSVPAEIERVNYWIAKSSKGGQHEVYSGGYFMSEKSRDAIKKHFRDRGFQCSETNREGGFDITW